MNIVAVFTLQIYGLVLHESLPGIPSRWAVYSVPENTSQIILQISLAQQNIDKLETTLASVSTPGSPQYGHYLDLDEVNAMFGATNESYTAVESWVESYGVTSYFPQGGSYWF